MARKPKPFQQKRKPYAPQRRGSTFTFYVSYDLKRAITDVARAHGNISQSELVSSILLAYPDIAAQLQLYHAMGWSGADQGPTGAASALPDLWEDWDDTGLEVDGERADAGARKKRGKRRGSAQEALLLLGGAGGPETARTIEADGPQGTRTIGASGPEAAEEPETNVTIGASGPQGTITIGGQSAPYSGRHADQKGA